MGALRKKTKSSLLRLGKGKREKKQGMKENISEQAVLPTYSVALS